MHCELDLLTEVIIGYDNYCSCMAKSIEERDVGKIVMEVFVFLVFRSFSVLVGVAHLMKCSEPGAASETAPAQEEAFWKPLPKTQPPPGKKAFSNEEKIKETNGFYFMENLKDLQIELLLSLDPNAPPPTNPAYDLESNFIFLAIQILQKQIILDLALSQFRGLESEKNNILLKELTTSADACGYFSATIDNLAGKIFKMEETVSDKTYKRAYILSRMTLHPIARKLVLGFMPAAGLQTPDPTLMTSYEQRERKFEFYDKISDRYSLEIPPEAQHILIHHSEFMPLKKDEEGTPTEEVYDPKNRILLYNPDATALLLWNAVKGDFKASDEDTADECVAELIELLSLFQEGGVCRRMTDAAHQVSEQDGLEPGPSSGCSCVQLCAPEDIQRSQESFGRAHRKWTTHGRALPNCASYCQVGNRS